VHAPDYRRKNVWHDSVMPALDTWLQAARADAERQGHGEALPILEALALAATALRRANWNADATGASPGRAAERQPSPPSTT
jgi:hypothetical protein